MARARVELHGPYRMILLDSSWQDAIEQPYVRVSDAQLFLFSRVMRVCMSMARVHMRALQSIKI
jgi:hypothetical protein